MTAGSYKLYRKMSLEEYGDLSASGLGMDDSKSIILCPKKCLSESSISAYRLNPYLNALSQVIAEFSFPMGFREQLLKMGQGLSHTMHTDRMYSTYKKYEGKNIYYKCHGSAIELYNHEIDPIHLRTFNSNITDINHFNSDDYSVKLLDEYFNVPTFEALITKKALKDGEYYIQLPVDLAILALRFNAIPSGGLNKFIKNRVITKDYDFLDQINNYIFPITLILKLNTDLLSSRVKECKVGENTYAINSNMLYCINKMIEGVRLAEYNEERAHYMYASDTLNNKVSISDILSGNIIEEGFQYDENQITLSDALNLIENNPIKDYFKNVIANINESLYLPSEYHGKTHAERVCLLAFLMATQMGIPKRETEILIQASLLHDIGRAGEYDEENHGYKGAEKVEQLALFINDDGAKNMVKFLIECHAVEINESIIATLMRKYDITNNSINIALLNILMDADALDRTRFTVFENSSSGLKPEYLRTPFSKNLISLSKLISKYYYNNSGMVLIKK